MAEKPTGLMAGAHPTAPGGMSRKALITELVKTHGWTVAETKPLSTLAEWPRLIDAVVQERRAREIEATEAAAAAAFEEAEAADAVDEVIEPVAEETEEDDFDDLAEFDDLTVVPAKPGRETPGDGYPPEPEVQTAPDGSTMFTLPGEGAGTLTIPEGMDFDPEEFMAELRSTREAEEAHVAEHGLLTTFPGTNDYIFDGHAGAGPSGSERWLTCTASLGASKRFLETLTPNQQAIFANSNEAARQGTTAHAAAEVEALVVLGALTQEEADLTMMELALLPDSDGEAYNEEMGEYITEYVDLVKSYVQERGDDNVMVEARVTAAVPLTDLHEGEVYEIHGSADFIAMPTKEDPTLVVGDLKYGSGIWVDVDENTQAMIYALGCLAFLVNEDGQLPDWVTTITMHIIQPRMDGIKTAALTVNDLLDWRDDVLAPQLTKALYGVDEGATFVPTETGCQFCPARGGCAALADQRMEQASEFFDAQVEAEFKDGPGAFPETGSMDNTRLAALLSQVGGLIDLHKDLKAEAERRLYRGDSLPGFGLYNYQPPRKWKDGADDTLDERTELWVHKLVTPTAAEKALGPEEYAKIEAWVDKPDKRPVVGKDGDRRKKWEGRPPEAMFDVEEET